MNSLTVHIEDSLAVLIVDQPGSKVNVIGRAVISEFEAELKRLAARTDLHGLIIESAKPGIFIAGADLKELAEVPGPDHPPTREFIEQAHRMMDALESLSFPTVANVDGAALGGGLEVALACDFRLAGTHPKTKFGLPEITLGLIPGWGGTQRLPRIVGPTSAIEMILYHDHFDAESVRFRGLVANIVPSENLRTAARELLAESWKSGSWRDLRAKKQRPLEIDREGLTIEGMSEGKLSDAKLNAMSLSPEAMQAFRQTLQEQLRDDPKLPASLAALDVIEKGCTLPLKEANRLEIETFLKLAGSAEARQLFGAFFASRRK
ncbi:MAG: enoyl-CoA hydratase/isomerase family protein [Planctomycetes bacterium]|nr:enoyl-CoA hydratase/isomerase family protein [Planctomycetota bacterium]